MLISAERQNPHAIAALLDRSSTRQDLVGNRYPTTIAQAFYAIRRLRETRLRSDLMAAPTWGLQPDLGVDGHPSQQRLGVQPLRRVGNSDLARLEI